MDSRTFSRVVLIAVVTLPLAVSGQDASRGGWADQDWTYIYEGSFADGGDDGLEIAGTIGEFTSLDGSWDFDNPDSNWGLDLIADDASAGGAMMVLRAGQRDTEPEDGGTDSAEALGILDVGNPGGVAGAQPNQQIYFERFLTDRSLLPPADPEFDARGEGEPAVDFSSGLTIIARFRFFSLARLVDDFELQTELGLSPTDVLALGGGAIDTIEHDESPRESAANAKGMFTVSQRDVYAPAPAAGIVGVGGIYFGVAEDGDDSWDPANQVVPAEPIEPVDVTIAYILGGPGDQNFAFQGSGDARLIAHLRARGARVTVLDDSGPLGHQFYASVDPLWDGAPGPSAVAHDHDLILISSTVASNNVATDANQDGVIDSPDLGYRFRGVPYICWENGLAGKGYGWMAGVEQAGFVVGEPPTAPRMAIDIVDNLHPITEELPLGLNDVFFTPQRMSATLDGFAGMTVAPGVSVLARNPADNVAPLGLLCVADPQSGDLAPLTNGVDPLEGSPATARQVFFFLEDESAAALNDDGVLLFDRAVEWALGDDKAALLGRSPLPPVPVEETIPSLYVNLGASPTIESAGLPFTTRVLTGSFLRDFSAGPESTRPVLGGDTRVWAPLPAGTTEEFVSVYITVEPEADGEGAGPVAAPPRHRVKVYLDGALEPAIEIEDHHLDPDIAPAIAATLDGSGPNDGTGLGMGLWRQRVGGYLDVDYFGVLDRAVPPRAPSEGIGPFIRGDCAQKGEVNLTSGIFTLNFLFLGGTRPACLAACDSSGDGSVDLTTAIFTFNFLFLGGPPPPEPAGSCGPGTLASDAELGCESALFCAGG